jgi:hypothetical protein
MSDEVTRDLLCIPWPQFSVKDNGSTLLYCLRDLVPKAGRVMLGRLEDGRLALEEIHRFPSAVVRVLGSLSVGRPSHLRELKTGLREISKRNLPIAVSAWIHGVWTMCSSMPCIR